MNADQASNDVIIMKSKYNKDGFIEHKSITYAVRFQWSCQFNESLAFSSLVHTPKMYFSKRLYPPLAVQCKIVCFELFFIVSGDPIARSKRTHSMAGISTAQENTTATHRNLNRKNLPTLPKSSDSTIVCDRCDELSMVVNGPEQAR